MALIVLASASGSPGVSTTALGLTLNWHRPVLLVDADPTGSSAVFAGYFHGTQEPTGGLINLALALREGTLAAALPRETLLLDPEARPSARPGSCLASAPMSRPRACCRCGSRLSSNCVRWTATGRTSSSTPAGSVSRAGRSRSSLPPT